jgi:hypothetical protein
MLMRPQTMSVPKDVTCPNCQVLLLRQGEIANITFPALYDDRSRLAQLLCVCEDCNCPTLIGYMPASAFGVC